jgi:hypothetical protein
MEHLEQSLQSLTLDENTRNAISDAFSSALNSVSANNDRVRTLASVLKPQKPSPYEGAIDAIACLNFIESQQEYFEIVELAQEAWVKYTVLSLTGDAKAWWRDSKLTQTTPWADFKKAFIDQFTPPDTENAALRELSQLKQKKLSVAEYTTKFRRLSRLIPDLDRKSALFMYLAGLEPETSKQVRLHQPSTLDEAINKATIIHSILYPTAPTAMPMTPVTHATPAATTPEPMDLDAMRVLLNNLASLTGAATTLANFRQPLHKLSDREREQLRRTGKCFRCRKPGHIASRCPLGRAMNNLETNDDETGKAEGEM